MTRAAIYARYSSDLQSAASIDDQVRLCRERALAAGHEIVEVFSDYAISASALRTRPGMLALMEAARARDFDVVIAEALDRISRDQEDVAAIFKRLTHADVKLVTLTEGEINELHVGLKGTMNALFLKDLAAKTHRGIRGRVEKGMSGGGLCYGYDVVRRLREGGLEAVAEASVYGTLRRLFADGLLSSYVVPSDEGPHRKYYALTKDGRKRLVSMTSSWATFAEAVERIVNRK